MSALMDELFDKVAAGKSKLVPGLVQDCLDDGEIPIDVLNKMISAMDLVGERFKNNEIFVPEMLVAARAMKKGVEVLKPMLAEEGGTSKGKVIIGTVAGDLHDIGKNLVAMMIESADAHSMQKSRSETPSSELLVIRSKPSSSAVTVLSMG